MMDQRANLKEGESKSKLEVTVKYGKFEATFSGGVDDVTKGIFKFLSEIYPPYETLSKITIDVNTEWLLQSLEGIIAKTPEGLVSLIKKTELTDKDAIRLHLIKAYLGSKLGLSEKDSLSTDELLQLTGKKPGAIAGRLSELVNEELVERVGKGEYRITTLGISKFVNEIIPKYKAREGRK